MSYLAATAEDCRVLGLDFDAATGNCGLFVGEPPPFEGGLPGGGGPGGGGCAAGYEEYQGTCVPAGTAPAGGGIVPGAFGKPDGKPDGKPPMHCALPAPWSAQSPRLTWTQWARCNQTALLVGSIGLVALAVLPRGRRR